MDYECLSCLSVFPVKDSLKIPHESKENLFLICCCFCLSENIKLIEIENEIEIQEKIQEIQEKRVKEKKVYTVFAFILVVFTLPTVFIPIFVVYRYLNILKKIDIENNNNQVLKNN